MIEFITIQEISANFPNVHSFLKGMGLNTHKNIFFESYDEHDSRILKERKIMMLRQDGVILSIDGAPGMYQLTPNSDTNLLLCAVEKARRAVNLKHHYLNETLERIEKSLNLRSSNALF